MTSARYCWPRRPGQSQATLIRPITVQWCTVMHERISLPDFFLTLTAIANLELFPSTSPTYLQSKTLIDLLDSVQRMFRVTCDEQYLQAVLQQILIGKYLNTFQILSPYSVLFK